MMSFRSFTGEPSVLSRPEKSTVPPVAKRWAPAVERSLTAAGIRTKRFVIPDGAEEPVIESLGPVIRVAVEVPGLGVRVAGGARS